MAEINLKKLSRAELLEMMISFSEEAEEARKHEEALKEEMEREMLVLQKQMADERAQMLKSFDEEKAQMRAKFNEQKAQMQEKFDKDIAGLKTRLTREKDELQKMVDDSLQKIEDSGNLAEASLKLGGIMEAAQEAADLYVKTLQDKAQKEYEEFRQDLANARASLIPQQAAPVTEEAKAPEEAPEEKPKAKRTRTTKAAGTTKTTTRRKKKEETDQSDE